MSKFDDSRRGLVFFKDIEELKRGIKHESPHAGKEKNMSDTFVDIPKAWQKETAKQKARDKQKKK